MTSKNRATSMPYVRQLGLQHFAYMRAVTDGIDMQQAAKMYLGIEHGHEAITAHREVVDHLRGLARRRNDKDWRLIGMVIGAPAAPGPSLQEWAAENGLDDGWSEAELQAMFLEANPADDRKGARNSRLRTRQLELLKSLQAYTVQAPQPGDPVGGWFDEATAERLARGGMPLIGDLQAAVARGGRWWAVVPLVGPQKARRIEAFLRNFGAAPVGVQSASRFAQASRALAVPSAQFPAAALPSPALPSPAAPARLPATALDGSGGANRAPQAASSTDASNDREAIDAWVAARAGSESTAKCYRREAERLLLWCLTERRRPLSSMLLEDCLAYMAFLEHIPPEWISRRHAARFAEGWAPFSKQLDLASRRQALVIVSGLFEWLVRAGYLANSPWRLVNLKLGDDPRKAVSESRAFTPDGWEQIRAFVAARPPSPAQARVLFVMDFGEATGLRASELLRTTLEHFRPAGSRWTIEVHGKGAKNALIAAPGQAISALNDYLSIRGLPPLGEAPPSAPLVASVRDPMSAPGYQALYKSTKGWFRQAIRAAELPMAEKVRLFRASLHWLRHTCGTRAVERGVPLPVIQEQLRHADPRTTMRYAKTQLERLLDGMGEAFDV